MRQRYRRRIGWQFKDTYYKPRGIPLRDLSEIIISDEELEVLRLRYIEKLDQTKSAEQMGISQSQYQRDLTFVLEKITKALVYRYALKIGSTAAKDLTE